MKTYTVKSVLFSAVVLAAAVAQAHVEPGSFLNKPARTVNQLVAQTERDPQVLDRFERHFQMSKPDLISYFEHLHVDRLRMTGSYIVYNCHDDEVIRARVFHLKAGTPVFADDSGRPILKIACGNPMVAPTPKVVIHVRPPVVPVVPHEVPPPPAAPVPPQIVIVPPTPPVMPAPIPPAPPVVNNNTSSTVINKNSSASSLFILPILLFIHGGHHSTTVVKQKQPTPEPASMLIMGFGAASLLIGKRRNKKA